MDGIVYLSCLPQRKHVSEIGRNVNEMVYTKKKYELFLPAHD